MSVKTFIYMEKIQEENKTKRQAVSAAVQEPDSYVLFLLNHSAVHCIYPEIIPKYFPPDTSCAYLIGQHRDT